MAIPEWKFGDWKGTGADNGSKAAKNMVYNALRSERSPLEQKGDDYWVKLQGSYAETTHTYGTSDVDVDYPTQPPGSGTEIVRATAPS